MAVVSRLICNHSTMSHDSASIPCEAAVFSLEEHPILKRSAMQNSFSLFSLQSESFPSPKSQKTDYPTNIGVTRKNKKKKRLLIYDDVDADDDGGVEKPKAIRMCKGRLLLEGYAEREIKQTNQVIFYIPTGMRVFCISTYSLAQIPL